MKLEVSLDDGHSLDLKAAKLLEKYGIRGMFYIPINGELSNEEIRKIAKKHDIGGHTLTHALLTRVDEDMARFEITRGKEYLEDIIGKEITSFCYPRGYYNEKVKQLVKEAGFKEGRTVKIFHINEGDDPYEKHTTIHVAQSSQYNDDNWFDKAMEILRLKPKYLHIWGHSWEIERDNNWEKFEYLLKKAKELQNESISRSR